MELEHLALVLALARAVLAAPEHQHHDVVALQLREPVELAVLVGQLEVGQRRTDLHLAHGLSLVHSGRMPGISRRRRYTLVSAVT